MDTLRVILLNIVGVRVADREKTPQGEHEEQEDGDEAAERPSRPADSDISRVGFFEGETFYLRRGDHKKLFAHFKNFYIHRVQFVGLHQKPKSDNSPQNREVKPVISSKSAKLAMEKRKKLLGKDGNVNCIEILLLPKGNQEWIEQ